MATRNSFGLDILGDDEAPKHTDDDYPFDVIVPEQPFVEHYDDDGNLVFTGDAE